MDIDRVVAALPRVAEILTVVMSIVAALVGVAAAMRLGVLKRIRLGNLEIEGVPPAPPEAVRLVERALAARLDAGRSAWAFGELDMMKRPGS